MSAPEVAEASAGNNPAKNVPDFLARVLPWAAPGAAGFINLHWTFPANKGMGGRPFTTLVDFMAYIDTAKNRSATIKDIYFCLSMQEKTGPTKNGYATAYRNRDNVAGLKAVWLDLDVKPSAYKTTVEALDALFEFCQTTGFPKPTAIVLSGSGGCHVYWISDRILTVEEWTSYAQGLKNLGVERGLKADYACTIDSVRVLRVPGTFNHKTNPPTPVTLRLLAPNDINFEVELGRFRATAQVLPFRKPKDDWQCFDPAVFSKQAPDPLYPSVDTEEYRLAIGTPHGHEPLAPEPMLEQCPMMADALKTGGRDVNQGLWMLQVLATTFCHNGREVAHRISKGYRAYTAAETDEMFDRKETEQADRNLGWPTCRSFENFGSKQCALCPHKDKIKSPLNLALPATPPDQKNVVGQPQDNPIIYYHPGNEDACRTALDKIVAADPSTFTSGEKLVILRVPDRNKPGLERWSGDLPGTTLALPPDVIERAEKLTWMTRTGGRGQSWSRGKPPRDFCTDYITQRRSRYGARPLVGIARVPHMRDDGSVRTEIGYDPETGIFVDRAPKLAIQESPTLDDAKAALQRVLKPFEHYTFEDRENGLLQIFAANLTALVRPYIKTAPLFAVNGVQSGTGKGQLCRATGYLTLGTTPPFMAWGHDDDEFTKRFDTMLLANPAMLVIDNCNNRLLRGDTLEMVISEGQATIRLFSKLEGVTVQNRTFIMPNGNNIQISGDMSRRSIKIGILPRSASPERDTFPFTPENYVIEHRDTLLTDYYTIMRAYRYAGMPRSGLPAVGSFPEWERKVRDLVWWLTIMI